MRPSITFLAGLAALTLTVTACGSDAKSGVTTAPAATSSPSTETTVVDGGDTTPVATMAVDDTLTPADTADTSAPGYGTELCAVNDELNNDPSPLDEEMPDPAAVQEYFATYVPQQMARLTAAAPDELKDEIATLAAGIETFRAVLEAHGWDINTAYDDPKMVELLGVDTEFTKAGSALDAYCGTNQ